MGRMFALVLAFVFVSIEIAAAQSAPAAPPAPAAAVDRPAGQPAYVPPKTPWGDPDLQGFWPSVDMVGVPLQRPARFGTRNTLTEEEFQKRAQDIQQEEESL